MSAAYLDGDIIAYRTSVKAQSDTDWGDEDDGPTVDTGLAIRQADIMVKQWTAAARQRALVICLSPEDRMRNFRRYVSPVYKRNRSGTKPDAYAAVVEWMRKTHRTVTYDWLEADDVMGMCLTKHQGVAVTIDKDLLTIPGMHLNPDKQQRPARVTLGLAEYRVFYQALVGDTVDGYPGLPGTGPVKATKILAPCERTESALWAATLEAFGDYDSALEQVRLARILRTGDYSTDRSEVRLWLPGGEREAVSFDQLEKHLDVQPS